MMMSRKLFHGKSELMYLLNSKIFLILILLSSHTFASSTELKWGASYLNNNHFLFIKPSFSGKFSYFSFKIISPFYFDDNFNTPGYYWSNFTNITGILDYFNFSYKNFSASLLKFKHTYWNNGELVFFYTDNLFIPYKIQKSLLIKYSNLSLCAVDVFSFNTFFGNYFFKLKKLTFNIMSLYNSRENFFNININYKLKSLSVNSDIVLSKYPVASTGCSIKLYKSLKFGGKVRYYIKHTGLLYPLNPLTKISNCILDNKSFTFRIFFKLKDNTMGVEISDKIHTVFIKIKKEIYGINFDVFWFSMDIKKWNEFLKEYNLNTYGTVDVKVKLSKNLSAGFEYYKRFRLEKNNVKSSRESLLTTELYFKI